MCVCRCVCEREDESETERSRERERVSQNEGLGDEDESGLVYVCVGGKSGRVRGGFVYMCLSIFHFCVCVCVKGGSRPGNTREKPRDLSL